MRMLNRNEVMVMKVWRLDGCENFVGKSELVFDAFSDFESVKRA